MLLQISVIVVIMVMTYMVMILFVIAAMQQRFKSTLIDATAEGLATSASCML